MHNNSLTRTQKMTIQSKNFFPNIPESEQQSLWFKLWLPIIEQRSLCSGFQNCDLFQTLISDIGTHNWKTLKKFTEFALKNAENTTKIFSKISKQIKEDKTDQDEVIQEMLGELNAIPCLILMGVEELKYHKKDSVDFTGCITTSNPKKEAYGIEITYLRKTNYHNQNKPLIDSLKDKYDSKSKQILKRHSTKNAILFITTNRENFDQQWHLQETIQNFVDSCEIPTIILCPGYIPYVSKKLDGILKPFDRNKYVELTLGLDAKTTASNYAATVEKLEAKFRSTAKLK